MKCKSQKLEHIAQLIISGVSTGYYPHWNLVVSNITYSSISDITLNHVAKLVLTGFTQGEIIEESEEGNIRGWWRLKISNI